MKLINKNKARVLFILFLSCIGGVFAQSTAGKVDYNTVYRFPFSIGAEYQIVSPVAMFGTDFKGDFSQVDFSVIGRFPIPSIPQIQPQARLGIFMNQAQYSAADPNLDNFDYTRFFVTAGLAYQHKLNKQVEVGADAEIGIGYSVFSNISLVSDEAYGAVDLQVSAGGTAAFNPSYNISLQLRPSLRYNHSFSPLDRFNGFIFGIGIRADYRFGTDPDDPSADIRSIEFRDIRIDDMFAAMQSYYVDHPVGEVTLINTEKYPLTDLTVTFNQAGFMDVATPTADVSNINPGESITVPLYAVFNKEIFSMSGVTPLTGEVSVEYTLRSRTVSQSNPVSYDLYDKNSLTWDDDRKVAAFMTVGDSALANYTGYLKQTCKDISNSGYSEAVQTAMQIYYGLTEIGCLYQRDPTLSFEDAQGDNLVIDSVNLPRDTLKKLSGDCDDLTVLFNSLLESTGIETAFVTVPGHIYSMFSTGLPAKDYRLINPDKSMTINLDGILWVPVEITFIGEDDFQTAWRSGSEEFSRFIDEDGALGLYYTREAQKLYRPVGFEERDLGLQYGDRTKVVQDFRSGLEKVKNAVLDDFEFTARANGNKGSWNSYGIVSARFEAYDRAETAFNNALAKDRNYISAKINLANIYYLREEYQNALRLFHDAEKRFEESGRTDSAAFSRLLLNISKTYYEVENYDLADYYSEKLKNINPILADKYSYLADTRGGRAVEIKGAGDIMFIEE